MSPGHCSCPECNTVLRIRDKSFVGREIDCPDCKTRLVIQQDQDRKLFAERAKAKPAPEPSTRVAAPVATAGAALGSKLAQYLHSPLVLAWALAISVTAFAAILMLRPSVRFRTPSPPTDPGSLVTTPNLVDVKPVQETDSKPPQESPEPVSPTPPELKPTPVEAVAETSKPQESVPAHPNDLPPGENLAQSPPATPPKLIVPAPAPINLDDLLKQRIQKFSTRQPVSRQQLLDTLEEMLGAPIRYDRAELGEKNLEKAMSVDMDATTVGAVLKAVLEAAGWDYVVEKDGIRLKPRQVAGSP